MESNCPYCGAPGAQREAVDGCCYVCGMMLPEASAGQATMEPSEPSAPAPEPVETPDASNEATIALQSAPSTAVIDDEGTEVPAIQLVQPRNLAPEYARRVTAAWQQTKSPFQNPRETLNSSSSKAGDPDNLLIGTRSLGSVDEKGERADYELSEVIGEGNMGTVWSARQASLDREVAVKLPKRVAGGSTLGREQFISEVVVTGQLDHPNIVPIYDMGRDASGQLFYAMKRVEGRSWDECIHEEGRTRQENVEILMKVCDAIRFAHDRGVIHRDIKPQNVMVGKYGEVSVMDWGIALRLPAQGKSASIIKLSPAGTPAYMAPEMATANAADIGPHTDVYLLGAVLYEIITREPPHPPPADSHDRLVQQNACLLMAARNVITPSTETGELIDIAYKAMATDISKRYQTVDEFQSAIREYFSHAESIALADRGHSHLAHALESRNGVYEDYAKARFAFGEALQLWPDNTRARNGLDEATMAYANRALKDGNYALGISLLDPANDDHTDLLKRLRTAKRRADRNRFVALASAGVAACCLLGGLAVSLFFFGRERIAKNDAVVAKADAEKQRDEATKQRELAEDRRKEADRLRIETEGLNRSLSERSRELAAANTTIIGQNEDLKEQIQETERQKNKAEQASYGSEIGLAQGHVQRNAFKLAQGILEKQARDEGQSKMRGWEWGHLWYQAQQPSIERFALNSLARVESVAYSKDKQWIAAGTDKGAISVWRTTGTDKTPIVELHGAPVTGVAISPDNRLLATVGGNQVLVWRLPGDDAERALTKAATMQYAGDEGAALLSVGFSRSGDRIVTASSDGKWQIWSLNSPGKPTIDFVADMAGPVYQARFSQVGRDLIVTAGHSDCVKVWDVEGNLVHFFSGHRGPVYAAEFSPDGNFVISGGRDRRLLVWDLRSGGPADSPRETIEARLTPVADEAVQNTIQFQQLGEHSAAIRSISFSQEGNVVFSASDDNTVRVWDIAQGLANVATIEKPLIKTLRGHGGWVRSCVAAADKDFVLSGSYDGQVFLWNWLKYEFPRVLSGDRPVGHHRYVSAAATRDARWIATASESGEVTVWDMTNLQDIKSKTLVEGHNWQATTAAYFNDGSRLLTSGGDNATVVWDARLGNQLFRLGGWSTQGGTGWRGVGAVSQNGRIIATGSDASEREGEPPVLAKLWDADSGRLIAELAVPKQGERPEATAIAFAPNDAMLFIGDQSGKCYVFAMNERYPYWSFNGHSAKVSAARFLSNGRLLTASSDGTVVKWNVDQKQTSPPREMEFRHRDRVMAMDVSSDERLLITAADTQRDDTALRLWDLSASAAAPTVEPIRTLPKSALGSKEVRSVAFHPTQPHALVTEFDPSRKTLPYQVGVWNWDGGEGVLPLFRRLSDTSTAMYAPGREGTILTVGGRGARLRLASQGTGAVQMSYRSPTRVQSVAFSPDSRLLAAVGDGEGSIKLWHLDDATNTWVADRKLMGQHQGAVSSVVFHPTDENKMLTAGADGSAKLWQRGADDWQVVVTFGEGQTAPLNQAIFSPAAEDGSVQVLTASDDGKVRIYQESGELVRDDISHEASVRCVAMSADRAWIVAGTGNHAVVWKASDRSTKPATTLDGHVAEVTSLAFSTDGRLITASMDKTAKLWDPQSWGATGADAAQAHVGELLTLSEHTDAVMSICLFHNADYPTIVTAGVDGQAILWPSMDWRTVPVQALGRR